MTDWWEYKELFIGNGKAAQILDEWGAAGWELVTINHQTMYAYMKRKR